MIVKYKGHKKQFPVYLPVGAKTKSTIHKVLWAKPCVELSDADAEALVQLDPHNFEIASEAGDLEVLGSAPGLGVESSGEGESVAAPPKARRGRPVKVAE